ncbi:hypothetical protein QZH41_020567 [Actinostola sp. cb2023]|nr:hypothetical protein QZH41_020567 [Actinostola sp. cb2023]
MKAFKSMEAYNFFVCGWVKDLGTKLLKDSSRLVYARYFKPTCFERDLRAELMGAKPKPIMKSGAIPTVFSHRQVEKKRRISSEKRREDKDKQEFLQSIFENSEAACSMDQQDVAMEAMETLPDSTNLACEPHTKPSNDYVPSTMLRGIQAVVTTSEQCCQVNMRGKQLMLKTIGTQTEISYFNHKEQETQTEDTSFVFSSDDEDELVSSQETIQTAHNLYPHRNNA